VKIWCRSSAPTQQLADSRRGAGRHAAGKSL
jgi:hypothetical protein